MRIVFMGTPEFAVPSLDILLKSGYDIVGVITSVDKMGGRGKNKVLQSDIKKYALDHKLNILQPKNLKSPAFIEELKALKADLQIVVAFRMLPEVVWNMPAHGTYNLHGSLLPKYRGAAPIHWAVINGEHETGVTSFKLKHEIDTGDFLIQKALKIEHTDTTGDVHDKMMQLGASVVLKTVRDIEEGNLQLIPQDESLVSKAPKLSREICQINWEQKGESIYNFIRGLNPYPIAWTTIGELSLKVFKSEFIPAVHFYESGKFLTDRKSYLHVTCKDGYLNLLDVQLQGKKRLSIEEFLRGTQNLEF